MANNPFVHVELETPDLAKAKTFYSGLFDWDFDDTKMEDYTIVEVGDHKYGVGGGMMTVPSPDVPPHWLAYVSVDDINASTQKAKSLGAAIVKDVTAVGDIGWMSIIRDPAGAVLGLWKSKQGS